MKNKKYTGINSAYINFRRLVINIIIIIGTIGLIYSTTTLIIDMVKESNKVKIMGTITEVSINENKLDLTVEYEVQRIKYKQKITTSDNDLTVNDQYEVTYNKNKPGEAIHNEHIIEITIGYTICAIAYILSLGEFINNLLMKKNIEKFKTEGILIKANIQDVMLNTKGRKFKKKLPSIVRLTYINPQNGQTYMYKTKNIYEDIKDTIERNNIKTIDVYLDKTNTNKYYIDLDSMLK